MQIFVFTALVLLSMKYICLSLILGLPAAWATHTGESRLSVALDYYTGIQVFSFQLDIPDLLSVHPSIDKLMSPMG